MHNLRDVITELRKFIKYSNEHCSEVQNLHFENSLYELSLQYYMAALCEESQRALSLSNLAGSHYQDPLETILPLLARGISRRWTIRRISVGG